MKKLLLLGLCLLLGLSLVSAAEGDTIYFDGGETGAYSTKWSGTGAYGAWITPFNGSNVINVSAANGANNTPTGSGYREIQWHFYDNGGGDGNLFWFGTFAGAAAAIGKWEVQDVTYYYNNGTNWYTTGIGVSVGWHNGSMIINSTGTYVFLDDTFIFRRATPAVETITLDPSGSMLMYDDIRVCEGVCGEASPPPGTPYDDRIDITITDLYDGAAIEGANVTLSTGASNLTNAAGLAVFDENISVSYTVTHASYFDGTSTTNASNSTNGNLNLTGAGLYLSHYTTLNGNLLLHNLTVTTPEKTYANAGENNTFIILKPDSSIAVTYGRDRWNNKTITYATTGKYTTTAYPNQFTNAYLIFAGDTSGTHYATNCNTSVGTYLTPYLNYFYETPDANSTITCDAGVNYLAYSGTLNNSAMPMNLTFTLQEYKISLDFGQNTSGRIVWQYPNGTGDSYPEINETADWDSETFQYIKVTETWPTNTLVSVIFNPKKSTNDTAQFYEFLNDRSSVTFENLQVLSALDYALWIKVENYGGERLNDAVIRMLYCYNGTGCKVVNQRVTQSQTGDASKGTLIYVNKELDYHIIVSKTGYQTQEILARAYDYDDNNELRIQLRHIGLSLDSYDDYFDGYGPGTHSNESSLIFLLTRPGGGNYYYNTTFNRNIQGPESFHGGGDALSIDLGEEYAANSNFTLFVYTRNESTDAYTARWSHAVTYEAREQKDLLAGVVNNTTFNVLIWILLILASGVIGNYIKMDETVDTGMLTFIGGTVALSFVNISFFGPIALAGLLLGGLKIASEARGE